MTFRQPSSSGETTVALIIAPTVKPIAMPIETTAFASARYRPENHTPQVLWTTGGIAGYRHDTPDPEAVTEHPAGEDDEHASQGDHAPDGANLHQVEVQVLPYLLE